MDSCIRQKQGKQTKKLLNLWKGTKISNSKLQANLKDQDEELDFDSNEECSDVNTSTFLLYSDSRNHALPNSNTSLHCDCVSNVSERNSSLDSSSENTSGNLSDIWETDAVSVCSSISEWQLNDNEIDLNFDLFLENASFESLSVYSNDSASSGTASDLTFSDDNDNSSDGSCHCNLTDDSSETDSISDTESANDDFSSRELSSLSREQRHITCKTNSLQKQTSDNVKNKVSDKLNKAGTLKEVGRNTIDCHVCYSTWDEIMNDEDRHFVAIDCGHIFCNACIYEVEQQTSLCPICRHYFSTTKRLYF